MGEFMFGSVAGVGKCFVTNGVPFAFEGLLPCVTPHVNLLVLQSCKCPGASRDIPHPTKVRFFSRVYSEVSDQLVLGVEGLVFARAGLNKSYMKQQLR